MIGRAPSIQRRTWARALARVLLLWSALLASLLPLHGNTFPLVALQLASNPQIAAHQSAADPQIATDQQIADSSSAEPREASQESELARRAGTLRREAELHAVPRAAHSMRPHGVLPHRLKHRGARPVALVPAPLFQPLDAPAGAPAWARRFSSTPPSLPHGLAHRQPPSAADRCAALSVYRC